MKRHHPCSNTVDNVVKKIGECDAIYGCVYGKGKEDDAGNVGKSNLVSVITMMNSKVLLPDRGSRDHLPARQGFDK